MKDLRKIAIYSRKSKFTGKGDSIGNQVELCKQNIFITYPDINEEDILIFEDEGFSGGNTNRPQFQRMMEACRNKQIKCIVCYRLDRISRNVGDYSNLINELNRLDISFISVTEKFDTTTNMGRAMMYIASVFAQLERETIAERIRDNMIELAKDGRWLGGVPPTGYKSIETVESITIDGRKRKARMLEIIPEEAELIKIIFEKFLECKSLTKTETYLIQNDYVTKTGKLFTRFAIKAILTNPVYLIADKAAWNYFELKETDVFAEKNDFDSTHGIMAYNKTNQNTGKTTKFRDIKDWIIAVGKHQGLICGDDWIKTQTLLTQNKSKSYRKPKSNVALLSGLLRCKNCGSFIRPKLTQRINKDGELIYDYLCELKEKSRGKKCNIKRVNGNELDKAVCLEIKKLTSDKSEFLHMLKKEQKRINANNSSCSEKLKSLKANKREVENKIKTLVQTLSMTQNSSVSEHILNEINELDSKIKSLTSHIKEYEELEQINILSDVEFETLAETLCSFANSFEKMSVEQKRLAIRSFIKKVVWDGEDVHIYFFGHEEDEIDIMDDDLLEPQGEDSKCYPINTALNISEVVKQSPFSQTWKLYYKANNCFYVLYSIQDNHVVYTPLFIYSIHFINNRHLLNAQLFLFENPNVENIKNISDKLKWFRYQKGLLQSEVANAIEVDRATYARYEENKIESYPIDKLIKIADLYKIDVTILLDEYTLFIYNGQGKQIKKIRKSLQLTQSEFAKHINIKCGTLKTWERNRSYIKKETYEKLIKKLLDNLP